MAVNQFYLYLSIYSVGTPIEREFYTKMKDTAKKDMDSITCDDCALLPNDLQGIKDMFDLCTYNKVADKVHDQVMLM